MVNAQPRRHDIAELSADGHHHRWVMFERLERRNELRNDPAVDNPATVFRSDGARNPEASVRRIDNLGSEPLQLRSQGRVEHPLGYFVSNDKGNLGPAAESA